MFDEELVKQMNNLIEFKTAAEIDEFLELIYQVNEDGDPRYLPYLLELYNDEIDFEGESDEALKGAIEAYPDDVYTSCLLKILKTQYSKAKNKIKYLFWGIFNSPECFKVLKASIHLADKETLLKVLQDIENDEPLPQHVKAIQELRKLLGSDG